MQSFFSWGEGGGGGGSNQGALCEMCKWGIELPWGWITPFRKSTRVPGRIRIGLGG